jgi:hypothetical protein
MIKENRYAPIALFAYKRLETTRTVLDSLKSNAEAANSILYIFANSPKVSADADEIQKVKAVQDYAHNVKGFAEVHVIVSPCNKGCAPQIIGGINYVLGRHERVIVLEDDLVVSPFFLEYMNGALEMYGEADKVASVCGFMPDYGLDLPETFFHRAVEIWGWGTWKRAWELFNPDTRALMRRIRDENLVKEFEFHPNSGFLKLLQKQIDGKVDTWDITWYASVFLAGKLVLRPGRSLVSNIGYGEDATHTTGKAPRIYTPDVRSARIRLELQEPVEDKIAFAAYCRAGFFASGGYFVCCRDWLDENCHIAYSLLRRLCRLPTWPWRKIKKIKNKNKVYTFTTN